MAEINIAFGLRESINYFFYQETINFYSNWNIKEYLIDTNKVLKARSLLTNFTIDAIKIDLGIDFNGNKNRAKFLSQSKIQFNILDVEYDPIPLVLFFNQNNENVNPNGKTIITNRQISLLDDFIFFEKPIYYPYGGNFSLKFFPCNDFKFVGGIEGSIDFYLYCKTHKPE